MEWIETQNYAFELSILIKVALAMILGAFIGAEREIADKPAGLRTHMIVASSAALMVSLSGPLGQYFIDLHGDTVRIDPIRIVEAVITGISFLGAGTIIQRNRGEGDERVEGLTTAASLLFSAGLGICVALSLWVLAVGATVLALATLRGLRRIEKKLSDPEQRNIQI